MHAESSERPEDALEAPPVPSVGGPARDSGPLSQLVARAAELARHGRATAAYRIVEPQLAREGGHAPIEQRAALLIEASAILWLLGRFEESESRARRGLALAEQGGDARQAAEALLRQGLALHRRGLLDAAREAYEEAGARFRRLGEHDRAAAATTNLGIVCKDRGLWDLARTHFEAAVVAARRQGLPRVLGTRLQNLGVLELKAGRWRAAGSALDEACRFFAEAGDRRGTIANLVGRGTLARLERRRDDALAMGRQALELALAEHLAREEVLACELLGDLALDAGDRTAARSHYKRAQRLAGKGTPDLACEVLRRLAELALQDRDLAEAGRLVDAARGIATRLGNPFEAAMLERIEAERALALGQKAAAREALGQLAGVLAEMGERFERGRALALLAGVEGDPEEAMRLYFRASACFAETGAEAELHDIEQLVSGLLAAKPASGGRTADETSEAPPERLALVGPSRALARTRVRVSRAARQDAPVLLIGERGVGKSLVARLLHARSRRAPEPFVTLSCADLAPERIAADLFGDVRDSTPARERVATGALARANGGTLHLDEIAVLPWPAQSALLRFLERGLYYRVGELEPREAAVRILASTRMAPSALGEALRPDLLARFGRFTIRIPALRERREDIVPIARAFLAASPVRPAPRLSAEAASLLIEQPWFGNVADLRVAIEQLLEEIGSETTLVGPDALAPILAELASAPTAVPAAKPDTEESSLLQARLRELERQKILRSLARARGNKTRAAHELKIARKTLYERMRKLGIEPG